MSRRDALKLGAATAAAAVVADAALADEADASSGYDRHYRSRKKSSDYSDEMFDIEAAKAGAWAPSRYGTDDQRGAFNELTPRRTGRALRRLDQRSVNTYQLGEEMFNGFPAFTSIPPREHNMFCYTLGFDPGGDFTALGGIVAGADPLGPNELTGFEERFTENFTFQIASQIDGLNHIGVGTTYYNGFDGIDDMAAPLGTKKLGNEHMGPVVTRGVILDIVGLKVAAGATDDFFTAPNGEHVLRDDYRITIDDIENAMFRQRVRRKLGPGDVPILHTGWTHLVRSDPSRYLVQEPGVYLAEARYFADCRVSMVAGDTWGFEVRGGDDAVHGPNIFPVHQELITKNGIRIGESFVTDSAIADNCYDGVLVATPENVPGATCGSSPPAFLGNPGRPPRRHRHIVKS
ncbi:MAG: cyclase family protein [Actinomycetota bacterium]